MNILTTKNAILVQKAYDRNLKKRLPVHDAAKCAIIFNALSKVSILACTKKYKGGKVTDHHIKNALASVISLCIIMLNMIDRRNQAKVVIASLDAEVGATIVNEETVEVNEL